MNIKGEGVIHFKNWESSYIPHILRELYLDKVYKPYLEGRHDLTIMDWGMNIGLFSMFAAPHAKVIYGFEPAKETFEIAKKNIVDNGIKNVEMFQKAITKNDGTIDFFHNANTTMNSTMAVVDDKSTEKETVEAIRPDTFVEKMGIKKIDFLKWDTEGNEGEVLNSTAFENIAPIVDSLVMELHSWNGYNPQQIITTLRDYGYVVNVIPSEALILGATKK